ncbi:MAG: nucleotidyl transferase AbiEii/AbiGii toxin family protein [Jatrophihabitantaceae bacterium]
MGDLLRADLDSLGVLCARAADYFSDQRGVSVLPLVIEKDFWATEILRALSTPQQLPAPNKSAHPVAVRPVFKGGTSLSKAYQIIERFSEDIDIFLAIEPTPDSPTADFLKAGVQAPFTIGAARIDTIMKATAAAVGDVIGVVGEPIGNARSGTKRGYAYRYPRPDHAGPTEGFAEGVLLELVRMGTPTPNAQHQIRSMLSDFVAMQGVAALSDFEELTPFTIDVLAPERTLVDKLCILHDVATRVLNDEPDQLRRQTRHYYDVHQLLSNAALLQSFRARPGLVADYATVAAEESRVARRPTTPRPAGGFATSAAFINADILSIAAVEYEQDMSRLRLGQIPTLDDVVALVATHADLL